MNHRIRSRAALIVATAVLTLAPTAQAAAPGIREIPVDFPKGESGATLEGKLKGDQTVDYTLRARAGQPMVVLLKATNASANFNVLPPGSETALFVGSTSGERFEGILPADGVYRIRVYLMRSAARRGESTSYTLDVRVAGDAKGSPGIAPPPR
jgi:hypothetical protein